MNRSSQTCHHVSGAPHPARGHANPFHQSAKDIAGAELRLAPNAYREL